MTGSLAAWSLVAVYSAAAIYAIALVMFAFDLAKRSAEATARRQAAREAAEATTVGARPAVATATLVATEAGPDAPPPRRLQRTAYALTVVGWLVHVGAIAARGIAGGRVPWANMFEFALTGTGIIVGTFVLIQLWRDLRFLGTYVTGLAVVLLMLAERVLYVDVVPLPPALNSGWLVIHVLVAILGAALFAIGAGLSILQLMQSARERGRISRPRFLTTLPDATALERLAYRVNVVGFVAWTFTIIFGAIWAERAWGRFWGWDVKEVWSFVIWVVFAAYIHARATRGWTGSRAAWLAIAGFVAVVFNFTVVNLVFEGLHSYSGL